MRPGRVAVFVDVNDAQWQSTCLRVIEYFTRLWGGCGNIIVPTDGKTISPLLWRILERFDPDYLKAYARTGRDIEIEEPAKFEDAYQRHVAAWEKQIGEKSNPHAAETIRDNLRSPGLSQFGISPELQHELRDRLAPFYFQHWIVEAGSLGAGSVPHYPHTDVLDILPYAEHSKRVMRVSDAAPFPQLWWASSFGSLNPELQAQLAKSNIEAYEYGRSVDEVKLLINLGVKGYEEIESAPFLTNTSLKCHPGNPPVRTYTTIDDWARLLQIDPTPRLYGTRDRSSRSSHRRLRFVFCPFSHAEPGCLDSALSVGTVARTGDEKLGH